MTRSLDSGAILLARIALAALFLWGGEMKLTGFENFVAYLHSANVPLAAFAASLSMAIDLTGGLFLVLGLVTRPLAVIMAIYTVATAILGHDFWNIAEPALHHDMAVHFWKNVSIAGGFLLLRVTGAGYFSVDRMRAAQRMGTAASRPRRERFASANLTDE
jgi:putative oxidoreductase